MSSKRKAKPAVAKKKQATARRRTPAPKPTPIAAAVPAAAPAAVAEVVGAHVVVEGCVTTRHYEDGRTSQLTHGTEEAAQEYAESVKGAH